MKCVDYTTKSYTLIEVEEVFASCVAYRSLIRGIRCDELRCSISRSLKMFGCLERSTAASLSRHGLLTSMSMPIPQTTLTPLQLRSIMVFVRLDAVRSGADRGTRISSASILIHVQALRSRKVSNYNVEGRALTFDSFVYLLSGHD